MGTSEFFSQDYFEARRQFRDAVRAVGGDMVELRNEEAAGPGGEPLFTDVVRFGDSDAHRTLIMTSATHGVEGFCGSGAMVGFLRSGLLGELPKGVAWVLVHALNPYGFSHLRRVTEGNIDLNRNVRDYKMAPPKNAAYAEIHSLLVPADCDGPARAAADASIASYIDAKGIKEFQAAVTAGQYDFADGLFYGGRAPTWSNRTWRELLRAHGAAVDHLVHVDFHTGLGPRGECELICAEKPDSPQYQRARDWFGDTVKTPLDGSSESAMVHGPLVSAVSDELPDVELTWVAPEYGTLPLMEVLDALRGDNWLHVRGDAGSKQGREISRRNRDAFYGDDPQWKSQIFERAVVILRQCFAGIADS